MLRKAPTWAISLSVHLAVLGVLAFVPMAIQHKAAFESLETFFSNEERPADEFTKEFDTSEIIAETNNVIAGAMSATAGAVGGNAGTGGVGTGVGSVQGKIDSAATAGDVDVALNIGNVDLPGGNEIGNDLGMEMIAGETGAMVGGYGPALDRLTQELMREMRDQKIAVVWMFDESESMKDDQADIKSRIHRVYEELRIVDEKSKNVDLVNAITSFGAGVHYQTPRGKATDKIPELMQAIDKIPNDPSGTENTYKALIEVVNEYRPLFVRAKRKLIVILVSDESGDDGELIDDAITVCKKAQASVYVLGRESVFGTLFAYVQWVEPTYKSVHWLPVRRGPETAYPELLQFDGFIARNDASMSGFGPYEQCRLARDTGGIFFMLPKEDENVINHDLREYAALDLKPYAPDLRPRREYVAIRENNAFRKGIFETILMLDPRVPGNDDVQVPVHGYALAPGQYESSVQQTLNRCAKTWERLTAAEAHLNSIAKLREKEDSRRWRANFDMMLAQMKSYRVRLFQYAIGLEHFGNELPKMKHNPKNNMWSVGHGSQELLKPSDVQAKKYKVTLDDLKAARDASVKEFDKLIAEHPNTPWAERARWEKGRGYGASYHEWFQGPPPQVKPGDPKPQPIPKL